MGVLYDYFSAPDDATAAAAIDLPGGPGGAVKLPARFADLVAQHGIEGARKFLAPKLQRSEHGFHAVATKNFDPYTALCAIVETLVGSPFADGDELVHVDPVALRDEGECFVTPLTPPFRSALAAATDEALASAAGAWMREQIEEGCAKPGDDPGPITDLLGELRALARGAVERGERLYCWICL